MKQKHIDDRLSGLRFSNSQGNIIPLHHAFLTLHLSSFSRIVTIVMPAFFLALIWLLLPFIVSAWGSIFQFWMTNIYGGDIGFSTVRILGQQLTMPFPILEAVKPSMYMVYVNLTVCLIALAVSFMLPTSIAPVTYLLRAALIIQASASIARMLSPDFFPYTMQTYMTDSLSLCIYLVFLLPLVLALVYYIFDFGLVRKASLTLLMLAYYFIALPCQYMLHAYIIHEWTLLFLPLMYLLFGTLLDVLMFVSMYAFGMSWRSDAKAMHGRGL